MEVAQTDLKNIDLNKIIVRLKDDVSEFHLFTPETSIENNQITIKRTIYFQQFLQSTDKLSVTIKNINNIDITGKLTVQASLNINQNLSTYKLLEENLNIAKVTPQDILQICSNVGETHNEDETVLTILGTI